MPESLHEKRLKTPCRYCGGIFRLVPINQLLLEYVLRCDKCGLQTKPIDCGEHEEEQSRLILGESTSKITKEKNNEVQKRCTRKNR